MATQHAMMPMVFTENEYHKYSILQMNCLQEGLCVISIMTSIVNAAIATSAYQDVKAILSLW